MNRIFSECTFVVIDVETTGVTSYDRICEIGITKIGKGRIIGHFETLINPVVRITNTVFHGIENWMVQDAPLFEDVAWKISRFIGNSVLIAHNAPFDTRFMRYELQRLGTDLSHYAICTLKLARRLHPDFPYHRLDYLTQQYGIVNEWPHRAGSDSDCEARLFLRMKQGLRDHGIETLRSLNVWGLPYKHVWCRRTAVQKRKNHAGLLTRDDVL
jgi:DNA polymerase-3 subunit alpha (Gram-positive type)